MESKKMGNKTFKAKLARTTVPEVHHITLGGYQSAAVCAPPKLGELPGCTTPHQLFLASVGSCVNVIFEIALGKARIEVIDITSEITGEYKEDEETKKNYFTAIHVDTVLTVAEGIKKEKLERLFEIAHTNCPIGNCLVGSCVELKPKLTIKYQ
jgi:uncharacterized OsmC-like protein